METSNGTFKVIPPGYGLPTMPILLQHMPFAALSVCIAVFALCSASYVPLLGDFEYSDLVWLENPDENATAPLGNAEIEFLLIQFWNATNGPYWWPQQWDFQESWSEWPGISVDEDGMTFSLDLEGNNLTGKLPSNFFSLPLSYLGLRSNKLSGPLPLSLCASTTISTLSLSNNFLDGELPFCIGNASTISSISLASNLFSGTIPESIYNLSELMFLVLNGNNLTGTISSSIGRLTKVLSLDLSNNAITGTLPLEMRRMASLSQLMLSNNRLTGNLTKELLQPLGYTLSKFVIAMNDFEGPLRPLSYLNNATVINVSHNRFSAPFIVLRFLAKIVYLDVSYNRIADHIELSDFLLFTISDIAYFNTIGNPNFKPSRGRPGQDSLKLFPLSFSGDTLLKTSEDNWSCKTISTRGQGITLLLDPTFLNYTHCACNRGYYGFPPDHCYQCPTNASLCANGVQLTIPHGMFPYPVLESKPLSNPDSSLSSISSSSHKSQGLQESEKSVSIFSTSFWNLERLEKISTEEESTFSPSKLSDATSTPYQYESPEDTRAYQGGLSQPVFFEPCFSADGCSSSCLISLMESGNSTVAYMSPPRKDAIAPHSSARHNTCHCSVGYSGRRCSMCVCNPGSSLRTCYYRSYGMCKECRTVWSPEQTVALAIGLITFILLLALGVHILILRSNRRFDTTPIASKNILRRAFRRILHVRTIGYFKLLLIFVQTLSAIVVWPTASLQRVMALLNISNGNTAGIGLPCLWTGMRIPLINFLGIALLPFALVLLLGLSIVLANMIWRIVFRPNTIIYQLLPSEKPDSNFQTFDSRGTGDSMTFHSVQADECLVLKMNPRDSVEGDSTEAGESSSSSNFDSFDPNHTSDANASDNDDDGMIGRRRVLEKRPEENGDGPHFKYEDEDSSSESEVPDLVAREKGSSVRYFSAFGLFVSEFLAVTYFFYFGVTLSSLSFFTCETQVGTGDRYVQDFPWLRCNGEAARTMRLVSIPFLALVTVGVPLCFASLLFYYRKARGKRTVKDVIGGLYRCYRQELFWWEMVVLARRLLLALVLRIPRTSVFHPWAVVLVLIVSVALQFVCRPFQQSGENWAEGASLLLLILTFVAQEVSRMLASSGQMPTHITPLFWLSVSLNIVFVVIIVGLILKAWWTTPIVVNED